MQQASFSVKDIPAFETEAKIALISTINEIGLPHITLITTLQALGTNELVWGQFTEGLSKQHVQNNPKTGFLIMTMDRSIWRGKATWYAQKNEGPEYEMFNLKPMFRYNAYFGIHTIHYMHLNTVGPKESIPYISLLLSILFTRIARFSCPDNPEQQGLNTWSYAFVNRLDTLKFMAFIDDDHHPKIIPIIQCQAMDKNRLIFSPLAYNHELKSLKQGQKIAIFALSLSMESVLIRGSFLGFFSSRLIETGQIAIEWIYNSMPPTPGQIYPVNPIQPIENFN